VLSAGRLLQFDTPKAIYERPATRTVAEFIGASSFLDATVVEDSGRRRLRLRDGSMFDCVGSADLPAVGSAVTVAVRAEHVRVCSAELAGPRAEPGAGAEFAGANVLRAAVRDGVYLGASYDYVVETPAGAVRLQTPHEIRDAAITVEIPAESIVVLAESESDSEPGA
jgi:ABC-type Fe3+/spermidine/putrescine transport system ATPase subunit